MATVPSEGSPHVIRPGRASLRTTYQLAAEVVVSDDLKAEGTFRAAVGIALDWLASKFPDPLPPAARQLDSFESDHHGIQQLHCVSLPEDGLWSARLLQPDAPFRGRAAVAGRTWTTELAFHSGGGRVRFGVRVLCASTQYASEPIVLTRPRIVLDLAARIGLVETRPIDGRPWIPTSEGDLQGLLKLVDNDERTLPVILLTEPDRRQWTIQVSSFMLQHNELSQKLQGLAHVVCMPTEMGFAWTAMVGKVWSAYNGAVRTYQPGLNFAIDSPFSHPLVVPERIVFWRHRGLEGELAFAAFLADKAREQAASKYVDWTPCQFYADARLHRASRVRERIMKEAELQFRREGSAELTARVTALEKAHREELAALQAKKEEALGEAAEYEQLASQYQRAADQAARENFNLQALNDSLRAALSARAGSSTETTVAIPDAFDDMAGWVEEQLTGRLVLHPRAIKGLKDAAYHDPPTVFQALQMLAGPYRDMCLGVAGAKAKWEDGIKHLELRFGGSIRAERAGEHGDEYFVLYPQGTGQRRFLEFHLRKGSTKDKRYCLGIYFFWDEETQRVVVGWLPSHLDTRAT